MSTVYPGLNEARRHLRRLNTIGCTSLSFVGVLVSAVVANGRTYIPVYGMTVMFFAHLILFWLEYKGRIGFKIGSMLLPAVYFFPSLAMILLTGGFHSPFLHLLWCVHATTYANVPAMDMIIPPTIALHFLAPLIIYMVPEEMLLKVTFRYIYNDSDYVFMTVLVYLLVITGAIIKQTILRYITAMAFDREHKASDAKSRFLATVSHEIRTPLTTILGWVELLLGVGLAEDITSKLNIIQQSGNHLLSVINDLLDYSKIETEKLELEKRVFHLCNTITSALDTTRVLVKPRVKLIANIDLGETECVVGDPHRLTQVIINLMSNAIKFTSEGSITFTAKKHCEIKSPRRLVEINFAVSDSGIGMDDPAMDKLFQPFSQVDSSMSRRYGGTGLGLSIAKQLVELMGGTIKVESTVGVGTTFSWNIWFDCELRYEEGCEQTEAPSKPLLNPSSSRSLSPCREAESRQNSFDHDNTELSKASYKVLLVEDNEFNKKIVQSMLCKLGLKVDTAENGARALEKIQQRKYDVVLMDFQMPILDGVEATKMMRRLGYRTPVVGITANADVMSRTEAIKAGMCQFITKPMRMIDLEYAIEAALKLNAHTLTSKP